MTLRFFANRDAAVAIRRTSRTAVAASAVGSLLAIGGCSATTAAPTEQNEALRISDQHVHGLVRDSGDAKIYVATHAGLLRLDGARAERVGPVIDLMGFTSAGPGHFLASGHPGAGTDLPQPVGLIESTNGGVTWEVVSRGGESDFHALSSSARGVVGFDGTLRSTTDKRLWVDRELSSPAASLASSKDGSEIFAATAAGLLKSDDDGATWASVKTPMLVQFVAWADQETLVGVGVDRQVVVSLDRGRSWSVTGSAGSSEATIEAMTASVRDGVIEVLVVTGAGLEQSQDGGKTFTMLAS